MRIFTLDENCITLPISSNPSSKHTIRATITGFNFFFFNVQLIYNKYDEVGIVLFGTEGTLILLMQIEMHDVVLVLVFIGFIINLLSCGEKFSFHWKLLVISNAKTDNKKSMVIIFHVCCVVFHAQFSYILCSVDCTRFLPF